MFGGIGIAGELLGSIILTPIADKFGRKNFTFIALAIQFPVYILLIFLTSKTSYFMLLFFFGITISMKLYITFPYLMELMHDRAELLTGFLFFTEGLVHAVSPMLILLFAKNTVLLIWIAVGLNIVSMIILLNIHTPESIWFSLSLKKYA